MGSANYEANQEFSRAMQPIAIREFYSKLWPQSQISELDILKQNALATIIDKGGADKMICFSGGRIAFLAQRFRRWHLRRYDDFTLRVSSQENIKCEFEKAIDSIKNSGFIASFYAYGLANKNEDNFIRFRILKYREVIQAICAGQLVFRNGKNNIDMPNFIYVSFKAIPKDFFVWDYNSNNIKQPKLF